MIVVTGILRFAPDKLEIVMPHLKHLVRETREHDGCLECNVAEDIFEPGLLRFSEQWPDIILLEQHLKAPHIAPWRKICEVNGLIERRFIRYETGSSGFV